MKGLVSVGLIVLLSGCVDIPEDGTTREVVPAEPLAFPLALEDCVQIGTNIVVAASALESRLPEGFAPTVGPTGSAVLGIEGVSCGLGQMGPVTNQLDMASVWAPVVPPEPWAVENARHYFRWHVLVSDGPWPQELFDVRVVENGDVTAGHEAAPAPMRGTIRFDTLGAIDMQGATASSFATFGYEFVDFFGDADGVQATSRANLTASTFHSGRGLVTLPEGSWMADAAGGREVLANVWTSDLVVSGNITVLDG